MSIGCALYVSENFNRSEVRLSNISHDLTERKQTLPTQLNLHSGFVRSNILHWILKRRNCGISLSHDKFDPINTRFFNFLESYTAWNQICEFKLDPVGVLAGCLWFACMLVMLKNLTIFNSVNWNFVWLNQILWKDNFSVISC